MAFKVNNAGTIIEFETQAEHDAWVADHSPTPDMTEIINEQIREIIGKDATRTLIKAIRTNITNGADKITVVKLLTPVLMFLSDGFIQDARDMANSEPTTSVFTTARKNFVLSEIDKALVLAP